MSVTFACTVRDISRFIDAPHSGLKIPDSAHGVQNEAVEEVNEALLNFLRSDR
jgi:pimeloyl-ACP methyl ester carboxylesterase